MFINFSLHNNFLKFITPHQGLITSILLHFAIILLLAKAVVVPQLPDNNNVLPVQSYLYQPIKYQPIKKQFIDKSAVEKKNLPHQITNNDQTSQEQNSQTGLNLTNQPSKNSSQQPKIVENSKPPIEKNIATPQKPTESQKIKPLTKNVNAATLLQELKTELHQQELSNVPSPNH